MTNLKLRYLIVAVLLLATASIVLALQHNSFQDETAGLAELQKIPMQIGKWKGQDLPLDESVYEILETRAIIHRNYTDDLGNTVLLSIVYYHDTKVDFHAPEACLGGRGERTEKHKKRIMINRGNNSFFLEIAEILASSVNGKSVSYYFYKTGEFMGQNYIKMRFNLAKNSLFGGDRRGSLIRFSVSLGTDGDQSKVEKLIESFMQQLMPAITG